MKRYEIERAAKLEDKYDDAVVEMCVLREENQTLRLTIQRLNEELQALREALIIEV